MDSIDDTSARKSSYTFEKTSVPGVFKRGNKYAIVYRLNGKQKWESGFRTLDEARRAKQARATDIARGEFQERSRITLVEYATEWVERYHGRGRRGFRDDTRDDYRRQLNQYAFKYFSPRLRMTEVTPSHIARFIGWLANENEQKRVLADGTIRNVVAPLSACFGTAMREGLIRSNPCIGVDLPHREQIVEDEDKARPFTTEQLATFLQVVHPSWRTFFHLLGASGLRWSEAIALEWRHVHLDGSSPHLKVRQRNVRGKIGPPKSKRGRRNVPLPHSLVIELRQLRLMTEWPENDNLVFANVRGNAHLYGNVFRRQLKPAAEEADAPWATFHTFRHTCASMLIAEGRNIVQVSRWLGHHSPSFTLSTYAHLMDDDLGDALEITPSIDGPSIDALSIDADPASTIV